MLKSVASLTLLAAVTSAKPAFHVSGVCDTVEMNYGCSPFCGYEPVAAGGDFICLPSGPRAEFPFPMPADDVDEYCTLTAQNHGCCDVCGYKWNSAEGRCSKTPAPAQDDASVGDAPIIGGSGNFKYQYMPDLLQAPAGASFVNCHGLVLDKDNNIYLTYQNDGKDRNCLVKWNPDGTGGEFMTMGGDALCTGTPHGLKITTEGDAQYLYHANNNQKLTKTTLNGTVIWQRNGFFGQNTTQYRPTWFATPPNSKYNYLCDGYGSNNVYAFDSTNGQFMNKTWGGHSPGKGPTEPHGTFSTNHGCTYDSRLDNNTIIVSDRANSRLEFFNYDPASYDKFEWYHTVDLQPAMGTQTLPCNIRMVPEQQGRAIIPDLSGPVAILDNTNTVISIVNVSVLLEKQQHKHPHDAIILPNGDIVVATWAPGRISYWKHLSN